MPKRAQIRALPTLGHGECLKLFGVNCSSSNHRNEFSCQGLQNMRRLQTYGDEG